MRGGRRQQDIDDFISSELGEIDGSVTAAAKSKPQIRPSSIGHGAATSGSKPSFVLAKKPTAFAKPSFATGKKSNFPVAESADQDDLLDSELNEIQNK